MEVVAEAADGAQALAAASQCQAQVVLMDLHLPDRSGIDVTRALLAERPQTAVLALTMHEDKETMFAAMRSGARGYLVKGADQDRILAAIRAVAAGEVVFGRAVADQALAFLTGSARPTKIGVPNRVQAVVKAREAGLVTEG
ncbi:response regulator transcription factor [Micromonospora sp. NPDC047620]|uniref:response regulator n=1 Tax=Micromonospora sp. NPDC047620 TaxID=3364251 RepID=UPI00370FC5BD